MKKFLALVLALVMTMSLVTVSASAKTDFTDDAKITNEEAVEVLNAMGVLTGYADGSFRPQATLTRGAGAKIIAYLMLGQAKADKLSATYTVYKDVDDSVGLAAYIEWAAANNIVDGYGDGNFGPYNTLTQYAFGKMLLTALGYSSEKEGYTGAGWQKSVYRDAAANGVFDGTESWGACDRETAARMALGALLAEIVAYGKVSNFWYSSDLKDKEERSINIFDKVGVITIEGAVETGVALWENYSGLKYFDNYEQDVFGRPGHGWTYGKSFDKFYMDAPVAEYTTATTVCDILVDCGYAKTSKASVNVDYYIDGASAAGKNDAVYSHNNCEGTLGGQGTLTQVFEVGEGQYIVTEIHTFLAQVKSAKDNTHKKSGTSVIDVYYAGATVASKAIGTAMNDVKLDGNIGYDKYDYILVNAGQNDTRWVLDDEYAVSSGANDYESVVIVGEPSVISSAKFTGVATDKSQATVAGNRENVAYMYSKSASGLNFANAGKSYDFFVDQYGNIIGDVKPAAAAYTYGVIADLVWVNDGGIRGNHYAEVLYYAANAEESVFTMASYDGKDIEDGDISNANSTAATILVSQKAANNAVFYGESEFLGVVKNYGDGDVVGVTNDTAEYKKNVSFEKSNPNITGMDAKVDNDTVFLVKTLKGTDAVYTSYEGIDALPTIKLAQAVAVTETGDKTATFVYIDATSAIFDGSSVLAIVLNNVAKYADTLSGTYEYEVYVNGEKITVIATTKNLGGSAANLFNKDGMYELNMNADGKIIKAEAKAWTEVKTASDVTDEDTVVVFEGNKAYNIANAKIYAVHYNEDKAPSWVNGTSVEIMDKADIDAGELVLYKLASGSDYVIDTMFVFVADEI